MPAKPYTLRGATTIRSKPQLEDNDDNAEEPDTGEILDSDQRHQPDTGETLQRQPDTGETLLSNKGTIHVLICEGSAKDATGNEEDMVERDTANPN